MVKQKVACLCGNLKRNILRRNNTTEGTIGSSPNSPLLGSNGGIDGENGSKHFFKKKSQKSANAQCSTNTPEEILCIFDKSLTIQHDPDEVTSLDSSDVPPEIPPRVFYPPPKQPVTANVGSSSFLLSPSKQEFMQLTTPDDRSTPSEHSTRSTASEIFAAPAASISSHSSNSSTDSFHCEGCHCSLHLSSNLQLNIAGKENNSMLEEYLKMNHPIPKTSKSTFNGFNPDTLEHSYSITKRFRNKTDEIFIPPKITPSVLPCNGTVPDESPIKRNQLQLSLSPIASEPAPILPPKSSEILSSKPCCCKNCTTAGNSPRASSLIDAKSKRPVLISPKSPSKFTHRNMSIAPFSIPSLCPEDEEETTYENKQSVEHESAVSAWPEVGEVLPTVSAYLQNQGKKRCNNNAQDKIGRNSASCLESGDQCSLLIDPEKNPRRTNESKTLCHLKTNPNCTALLPTLTDFRSSEDEESNLICQTRKSLLKINPGWFWGRLAVDEAESLLFGRPNGSFLVRDSVSQSKAFSLSFRCRDTTHHSRIEIKNGKFTFSNQPEGHASNSLVDFVEAAVRNSKFHTFLYILKIQLPKNKRGSHPEEISVGIHKNAQRRSAPSSESPSHCSSASSEFENDNCVSVQAELLYPLSRNVLVAPLKYLSRLAILRNIGGCKNVNKLKLDSKMQDYCLQCPFYNQKLVFGAMKMPNCSVLPQL